MTEPFTDRGENPLEHNPLEDPDPLLETGWFIDAETAKPEHEPETMTEPEPTTTAAPGTEPEPTATESPIMATPVSQRRPRKPAEEGSETPSWLPDGWRMTVRVRTSGATAGTADRYHLSPSQISRTPSFKHKALIDLNVSPKEECLNPDRIESTKSSVYHPEWLPVDWDYTYKVRTSGASAGTADKYFISPSGQRFRSKVEVLHYLETGSKRKMGKKTKSDSDAPPSESSTDNKKKKSKTNAKDFSDLKFDFKNPPLRVTWVRGDDSTDEWVPTTGDATIPVAVKKEWAKVYSRVTLLDATVSPGSP